MSGRVVSLDLVVFARGAHGARLWPRAGTAWAHCLRMRTRAFRAAVPARLALSRFQGATAPQRSAVLSSAQQPLTELPDWLAEGALR